VGIILIHVEFQILKLIRIEGIRLLLLTLILSFGAKAEARVFRLQSETVAAYFGGTYGSSEILQSHFSGMSGNGVTIDGSAKINTAGEFGFLFTSRSVGLRLGVEVIRPITITDAMGSDAGGVKLYDFESTISATIPKVAIELNVRTTDRWRLYATFAAGTASVTYKNSYTLTTDGQTAFPGLANFSDEATGTGQLFEGGMGFETLMNDTTTVAFTVANRNLSVSNFKHKYAVTNFTGTQASGDSVFNSDSSVPQTDFGGITAGLLFRFYLGK
jgi:hypothetical protein